MLMNISFRIIKVSNYRHEKDERRKGGKYFGTVTLFNLSRRRSIHTSCRSLPEVTNPAPRPMGGIAVCLLIGNRQPFFFEVGHYEVGRSRYSMRFSQDYPSSTAGRTFRKKFRGLAKEDTTKAFPVVHLAYTTSTAPRRKNKPGKPCTWTGSEPVFHIRRQQKQWLVVCCVAEEWKWE